MGKTKYLIFIPIIGVILALFSRTKYPWIDSKYAALEFFGSVIVQVVSFATMITLLAG